MKLFALTAREFEVPAGTNLARALLDNGVPIEHACELSCACTTCHCYIDKGFDTPCFG